ncbi:hypothetical protein CEXT_115571 [Caerostris extrusa]|uniref:Uncharacterized protein n=1 Tax=Caerostris extrusa TaxID=172846 RepID=A0AAV4S0T8_CAEEX|nr:hypothetical protein CEXT_115571 [Caerostris extrusa]
MDKICPNIISKLLSLGNGTVLDIVMDIDNLDITWILTDSRSSIQYLKTGPNIMDKICPNIISKLLSLVNGTVLDIVMDIGNLATVMDIVMHDNEFADDLARKGCDLPSYNSIDLCPSEIHSLYKN